MQITKKPLKACKYYEKIMMQIQKYPPNEPLVYWSQMAKAKFYCT